MNNENSLDVVLRRFRDGRLSPADISLWLRENLNEASGLLSRSAYLKLKQGSPRKAMLERLGCNCSCLNIYASGVFHSSDEFEQCMGVVNVAKVSGLVAPVPEPFWSKASGEELGAAGFYQCTLCQSVWKAVAQERGSLGAWGRIG